MLSHSWPPPPPHRWRLDSVWIDPGEYCKVLSAGWWYFYTPPIPPQRCVCREIEGYSFHYRESLGDVVCLKVPGRKDTERYGERICRGKYTSIECCDIWFLVHIIVHFTSELRTEDLVVGGWWLWFSGKLHCHNNNNQRETSRTGSKRMCNRRRRWGRRTTMPWHGIHTHGKWMAARNWSKVEFNAATEQEE